MVKECKFCFDKTIDGLDECEACFADSQHYFADKRKEDDIRNYWKMYNAKSLYFNGKVK